LQIRARDEGVDILQRSEIGGLADLVPGTRYVAGEARQEDPAASGMLRRSRYHLQLSEITDVRRQHHKNEPRRSRQQLPLHRREAREERRRAEVYTGQLSDSETRVIRIFLSMRDHA